jgi:iron complex outermembrane receptor protein
MDMPGYSKTYGIYGEGEMKINAKQKLLLRADGSTNLLNASMTMYQAGQLPMYMLTWPDNRKNQFGLSASWLLQIDSSLKVQVTGRTDLVRYQLVSTEAKDQVSIFGYPSANRNNFLKNISTSVSKNISHKISTNASLSYSERIPTASELYGFYLFNSNDGFDYIGNPGLNIEQSLQADISALYNWGKNRIQLTYYYSKVYNFITGLTDPSVSAMTIGATGVKSFINIANASITGLELSAVLKPAAPIDIISTLRYTRGKDNDNNPLPSIAPLKNTSSFRYQLNKAFVQLEYDAALKQNRINLKTGEDKTDGYILLNAKFGYNTNLFGKMVELQSGVENVLDKKYHEHLDWGNISRPGRNIYVLVKCVF